MANEVKITVTAEDRASAQISSISQSFGNLKSVAASAAIGFASFNIASKVFDSISSSIAGAFEAAESFRVVQAQTEAVIRSTGGAAGMTAAEIGNLSASLEQMSGIDEVAIQGAENLLLTFTNIGKDVFPVASEAVLDMSVALGQDLKSSAIQLGKALQDPIDGVSALRRVGVNFTDAQRDMIQAMVESGNAAGAQAFILRELNAEFGGSAKAAEDARGGINRAKDGFDDATRALADALLPTIVAVQRAFLEIGGSLISALLPVVQVVSNNIETLAAIIGGLGAAIAVSMIPQLLAMIPRLIALSVAAWGTASALTAQAVAMAAANPLMAAAAVAAALATGAAIKYAMSTNDVTEQQDKLNGELKKYSGEVAPNAVAATQAVGAAARSAAVMIGEMTSAQLEQYIATEQLKGGDEEWAGRMQALISILADRIDYEKRLKAQQDALHESLTGEKAAQEAATLAKKAATEATSELGKAYATEAKQIDYARLALDDYNVAQRRAHDLTTQLWRQGGGGMSAASATAMANAAQSASTMQSIAEGAIAMGATPQQAAALANQWQANQTIVTVNAGVIGDPAAAGKAVADAINKAANTNGPLISAGAVQ